MKQQVRVDLGVTMSRHQPFFRSSSWPSWKLAAVARGAEEDGLGPVVSEGLWPSRPVPSASVTPRCLNRMSFSSLARTPPASSAPGSATRKEASASAALGAQGRSAIEPSCCTGRKGAWGGGASAPAPAPLRRAAAK